MNGSMLSMKCAVFCCMGLGDGFITLVLSNNLVQSGWQVDTFHPFLQSIQEFFPSLPIYPFPRDINLLKNYDRLFILYEKSTWMMAILEKALAEFPEKTTVLNPIATPNCDYPFWEYGRFNGSIPFVENLYSFAKNQLGIDQPTRHNGFVLPKEIVPRKLTKRVIIHPTSSRQGKNWSKRKYLLLSEKIKKKGFDPFFILTSQEQKQWPEVKAPYFSHLKEMIYFVAESAWMVGNDSGIGHLASCIGLPTLTICRNRLTANFWRPAWAQGKILVPPRFIPNIKGLRLRDKNWQSFISVRKVLHSFEEMVSHELNSR